MTLRLSGQNALHTTFLSARTIGQSVEGRPIVLHSTQNTSRPGGTLFVGGIHGDERATVLVLESFMEGWLRTGAVAENVLVLRVANPDGAEQNTRYNARGVDLNRNCETRWSLASEEPSGPEPWSEPESRALRDLILHERPSRIVCLHWALAEIDADGPQSTSLAFAMWQALNAEERAPYRIRVWDDAPRAGAAVDVCPGSFGQWCGLELRYPDGSAPAMITLELPYDPLLPRPEILPADHLKTLHAVWAVDAPSYMAAVEGPVHKMLAAACRGAG